MHRLTGALLALIALLGTQGRAAERDPLALMDEVFSLMETEWWPGYDPAGIPVALYDGKRTLLFRHPDPPEGFAPLEGREGVAAYEGQHPQVKANTSIELGGVPTGVFLLEMMGDRPAAGVAGVVIHECFHVWQKENFPQRWPDSAELFAYPVDDAELLKLRRLETEAVRRSLAAEDEEEGEGWLANALALKARRMELLPENSREWERGVELIEGTAHYVESAVAGRGAPDLPSDGYPAERIRLRSYFTGHAWAVWLDRLSPDWKSGLREADPPWLDVMLARVWEGPARMAFFTEAEIDAMSAIAEKDAGDVRSAKIAAREEFVNREGWRIVVECPAGAPLWPNGFDPMNVTALDKGEILHKRWLKLGNASGDFEVNGGMALTEPAGGHPLYNGIRRVTVTGFEAKPELKSVGDVVSFEGGALAFTFTGAKWKYEDRTLTVYPPAA